MILTLVTHDRGTVEETSLQALAAARGLAASLDTEVHAVLIGSDGADLAADLGEHGASTVHLITHAGLTDYAPAAWGAALAGLVEGLDPEAVLAAGSDRGNEVIAHLGAITALPVVANCREITPGEPWDITRTRWGGSLLERASLTSPTPLLTITEHAVEAEPVGGAARVMDHAADLDDALFVTRIVDREVTSEGVTLATAPVVVGGGRGVGSAEAFGPLEELATLLGGVVGCSRVVTNNGWRPHSDQVGQTGTVIAPDLYIACGISGAVQHWVGMMAAKTKLAINTDPEAPMVTKADYAVIGDLHEVVPAIVSQLKARRA